MARPRTYGAERARERLPELIDRAARGETTLITRRGRLVAALVPSADVRRPGPTPSVVALRGTGKGLWGRTAARRIARMRDEW